MTTIWAACPPFSKSTIRADPLPLLVGSPLQRREDEVAGVEDSRRGAAQPVDTTVEALGAGRDADAGFAQAALQRLPSAGSLRPSPVPSVSAPPLQLTESVDQLRRRRPAAAPRRQRVPPCRRPAVRCRPAAACCASTSFASPSLQPLRKAVDALRIVAGDGQAFRPGVRLRAASAASAGVGLPLCRFRLARRLARLLECRCRESGVAVRSSCLRSDSAPSSALLLPFGRVVAEPGGKTVERVRWPAPPPTPCVAKPPSSCSAPVAGPPGAGGEQPRPELASSSSRAQLPDAVRRRPPAACPAAATGPGWPRRARQAGRCRSSAAARRGA